jgi:hypothetical protein
VETGTNGSDEPDATMIVAALQQMEGFFNSLLRAVHP